MEHPADRYRISKATLGPCQQHQRPTPQEIDILQQRVWRARYVADALAHELYDQQLARLTIAANQASRTTRQITHIIQQITQSTAQQTRWASRMIATFEQMAHASDGVARGARQPAESLQGSSGLPLKPTLPACSGEPDHSLAVVAEQVHQLSEEAKAAAPTIDRLIRQVRQSLHEAVSAIEATTSEVAAGAQLAASVRRSSSGLTPTVDLATHEAIEPLDKHELVEQTLWPHL